MKVKNQRLFGHYLVDYDTTDIISKLKSLYDLIALYSETNTKEIQLSRDRGEKIIPEFEELTKVLAQLVKIFQEIKICMREHWGNEMIEKQFSDYFGEDV